MNTSIYLDPLCSIFDQLVDENVGIVRSVWEFPREAGAPDFFHYYAEASDTSVFTNQKNFATSGGVSTDRGLAMAKAVGEAVERYCSAIYDASELSQFTYETAPFPCVAPGEFALYGQDQYARPGFPYVVFDGSTSVRWSPAIDAVSGEVWYVPASMVYLPYFSADTRCEPPILQPMSTGLACHCSFEEAAVSAICEVIERDAFTIIWQAKLAMPQIRNETLSINNRELVARFERTGGHVTLLDLAMDHRVPTILSILRSKNPGTPALVFAASSCLDPEQAVRKSLEELAHTRRLAQQIKTSLPPFVAKANFENVMTQDDHVHVYCDQKNVHLADFIFACKERIDFNELTNLSTGSPEMDLEVLSRNIRAVSHRALLIDVTTSDVSKLGLSVVRAIVPGFHPLFIGHARRSLGGRRLWEVPQRLGRLGITPSIGDNPAPHPFP